MNDELIYLATPYSHDRYLTRLTRFRLACKHAGRLMVDGNHVFSPIAHSHPIADRCNLPGDFAFWSPWNRAMLSRCTKLVVVKMDGWIESKGVTAEIGLAEELGIPVEYIEDVL